MGLLTAAEDHIKGVIFNQQIECTKSIGQILSTQGETLCGNDLEKLAQYLTVIGAVKSALEEFRPEHAE